MRVPAANIATLGLREAQPNAIDRLRWLALLLAVLLAALVVIFVSLSMPLDIGKVVNDAVNRLSGRSVRHKLTADMPAGLPEVPADRTRIERVLDNLIDNAIKYSPNGGEVIVSARRQGNEVLVSVADQRLASREGIARSWSGPLGDCTRLLPIPL